MTREKQLYASGAMVCELEILHKRHTTQVEDLMEENVPIKIAKPSSTSVLEGVFICMERV